MSETRLVVRELERDWCGRIHASCADRAIAALSADPLTLDELELAVTRFAKVEPNERFFTNLSPGLCDEPYDAGLVVIDLVARLVVVDSTYSSPAKRGSVWYHDGRRATNVELPYHLDDDWLFTSSSHDWRGSADERRRRRAVEPIYDARAIFYGRPLLEYVAREAFAAFARRDEIAAAATARLAEERLNQPSADVASDGEAFEPSLEEADAPALPGEARYASPFYHTIRQIHAAWMLTPREELGGATPREIALAGRDHIARDLEDRCSQWTALDECPPGLAPSSHAFRFGGFGAHELVKYYDLVRELLWSCWEGLAERAQPPDAERRLASLTIGDFLATEIPRLEQLREAWLDAEDPACHGRTPRSIIEHERARLPEALSGREAMIDPDCPCCQMLADLPGPAFWHFDGSEMDNEFAFDMYCRTREEWDEEQRRHEEFDRRFQAEWSERERLGVTDPGPNEDGSPSVWSRSFSRAGAGDVPLGIRVFGVGCRLAELIAGLRGGAERTATPPETQRLIDELNRGFGNLRAILQSLNSALSETLLAPVLDRCVETLACVAAARGDLAAQCDALADIFRTLLDPQPDEPDGNDFDVPF